MLAVLLQCLRHHNPGHRLFPLLLALLALALLVLALLELALLPLLELHYVLKQEVLPRKLLVVDLAQLLE